MTRKAKCGLVLIVLLTGVSILTARDRNDRTRIAGPVAREVDPYENRAVLVEAFVVQMDLAALYGMDVNPLGQAPHSVSVANLLEYLNTGDKAIVLVGAKATAVHGSNRNTAKRSEARYHQREQVLNTPQGKKETVDYVPYENGETLTVAPFILSEHAVALGYSFSYSGPRGAKQKDTAPLDTVSWSWNGDIALEAGQPRIIGATQDEKTAIFFVLTAHILE